MRIWDFGFFSILNLEFLKFLILFRIISSTWIECKWEIEIENWKSENRICVKRLWHHFDVDDDDDGSWWLNVVKIANWKEEKCTENPIDKPERRMEKNLQWNEMIEKFDVLYSEDDDVEIGWGRSWKHNRKGSIW